MPHANHVTSQPYGILLILILTAGLYLRGWLRLRSFYQNRIPAWRGGSFLLGIFLIWVAVASPIAGTAHELLTGHMVQHLLLMTFAAPSIWVGECRGVGTVRRSLLLAIPTFHGNRVDVSRGL